MATQFIETWLIPFRHDAWATRGMLERCRTLSDEQLHRRFDIGCGNLHDTFVHIIGCMRRWRDRVSGGTLRASIQENSQKRSIDELLKLLDEAAGDLEAAARAIHVENRHDEMMEWPRKDAPAYRFHKTTAFVHVITHGMHHRSQARWMMRQLGIELKEDFDTVEWELALTGQL